ncbi:unnamed protein product [Bemisia tabaci]|uniref:Uncharacterized protein n=1 Tax=Bemisia tabaci TaxID=7038 RepID=A0A9P0A4U8_BEMTA|nr:unnamed protein product [Bemisia tabaci]
MQCHGQEELLRESRLSLLNKRKVQESIQKGEPLPFLRRPASADERISSKDVMMRPKYVRRRPKELIVKSGAYEMDTFVPSNYKYNNEIEKERLQSMMTYGEIVSQKQIDLRKRQPKPREDKDPLAGETDDERFLELLGGIMDRLDFLQEMEQFGRAKLYRFEIGQEIAARFRLMKLIDPERCAGLDKYQILKKMTDSSSSSGFSS